MLRRYAPIFQHLVNKLNVISCCLVLIIAWSIVLYNRINERKDIIDSSIHETTNLANAISGYLQQVFGSLDQILVAARFTSITTASRPVLKHMAEVSNLDGVIHSLSLYNTDGNLVVTSAPGNPIVNIADRTWFKNFRDNADDRLFIGPPIISRTTNELSLILARGIRDDHGRFQGMVGMSITPEYFASFFRHLPMGHGGVINLIGRDGFIYVRVTRKETIYGQVIKSLWLKGIVEQDKNIKSGVRYVSADQSYDNVAKYFSFQAMTLYPLIVNVGASENDILKNFWFETLVIFVGTILFSAALVSGAVISQRRMNIIQYQSKAMNQQAQSLQARNEELANQSIILGVAVQHAQEADKIKGEFIANMSHELRTPLNAIIGFSSVLMDNTDEIGDPRRYSNLAHINSAGRHLLDLVTGVLEMAKLESGSFNIMPEVVDLCELTSECIEMTGVLREAKSIELIFDGHFVCHATCDQSRTRQIVLNILSNAIKFSPDGSRVTVKVNGGGEDRAVVIIADNGIGMTVEEIEIAMTPFAQVSSGLSKCYDGTGLGLPLAKRLLEVQGGCLALESVKGAGTTVRFDLPGVDAGL